MSYSFYKIIHMIGIMLVFLGIGGSIVRSANDAKRGRMISAVTSGIGLLLLLVAGFAIMAKKGLDWGLWVYLKIAIWVAIGGLLALINRKPKLALTLWICVIVLGAAAAYLGHKQVLAFGG